MLFLYHFLSVSLIHTFFRQNINLQGVKNSRKSQPRLFLTLSLPFWEHKACPLSDILLISHLLHLVSLIGPPGSARGAHYWVKEGCIIDHGPWMALYPTPSCYLDRSSLSHSYRTDDSLFIIKRIVNPEMTKKNALLNPASYYRREFLSCYVIVKAPKYTYLITYLSWYSCVSYVTGVLWFRLKSLHLAACQSTRWVRPPPAEHPLPVAHPTFSLLQQQHPRVWSTLQVREQAWNTFAHLHVFLNTFFFHCIWSVRI